MNKNNIRYSFDRDNNFIVENYNWAQPFSGFFPGIAGRWGIPLWTYYVSRGQAVCSLGSKDKDGAILEFLSFNRACQMVGSQGFRTFLRLNDGPVYEPFRKVQDNWIEQKLILQSHELALEEQNEQLKLKIQVTYFPLVQSPIAGLIRSLSVTNNSEREVDIQVLDGVPRLLPYGVTFENVKVNARHIEGMMGVYEMDGLPLFRLKQTAEDRAEIGRLEASNFYASFRLNGTLLEEAYLVDPEIIFGTPFDFSYPWSFDHNAVDDLINMKQQRENRTPCAFTALRDTIAFGEKISFYSILGYTLNEERLKGSLVQIGESDFFTRKHVENKKLIDEIKNYAFTVSSQPLFNRYCQETFLENVMRGGMPTFFGQEQDGSPFYIYARQNGDLERDYHWFVLEPTYLSQGNGHYRSICQNRRMDTWFFPRVETHNIKMFMNLIQLDGYNPLVINGQRYIGMDVHRIQEYLRSSFSPHPTADELIRFVMQPFTPGEFILQLEQHQAQTQMPYDVLLEGLLNLCRKMEVGDIHAGFWIDHWLYNLDLIDSFLVVYPDRLKEILWDDWEYTFYDNPDVVLPRRKKYVLREGMVRQYGAVQRDLEKESIISNRTSEKNKVRMKNGQGEVYRTNLFTKLLCLLANKIAVLDPSGIGVEMEAGKPGWNDSVNGLPGLMGSSLCQTLELLRAFRFMKQSLPKITLKDADDLYVFEELATFIRELTELLEERNEKDALTAWDQCHQLLEGFRARTRLGIDGRGEQVSVAEISRFLDAGLKVLEGVFSESAPDRLMDKMGVPYTYYVNEAGEYEGLEPNENSSRRSDAYSIKPTSFLQRAMPLFLEGPVHHLKLFPENSQKIYEAVRSSALFDPDLKMYKVCESLQEETQEIGRITAYPRGWIENESIYTHMEFKWLLEILRSGLVEQFYDELQNILPPYMEPEVYGRSTLENCSFIVSSAFPNPNLHGQAFQPRLSGVTAEWLEIWTLMVAGPRPFRLDSKRELQLTLEPFLPDWLFTEEEGFYHYWDQEGGWEEVRIPANSFTFRFLGHTLVIYHNPERRSTYGPNAVTISTCTFRYRDGRVKKESGPHFSDHYAESVRTGEVQKMDVMLG